MGYPSDAPADLEARALAAGASPEAAAAARAFVEALPEGTKMPTIHLDINLRLRWECRDTRRTDVVFVDTMSVGLRMAVNYCSIEGGFHPDWRPGQPVPARALELIARVAQ